MTFNLMICALLIGIAGNVINILNFQKQGLQDSVNVTLTALAVSDIGALFFQLLVNILFNPSWKRFELPFSSPSVLAPRLLYQKYSVVFLGWINIPELDCKVLTFIFRDNYESIMTYVGITNDLVIPYSTFLVLIVSTAIIVIRLKSKSTWRQSVTGLRKAMYLKQSYPPKIKKW
ncbi:FMRFamide receptor [Biomphalaria pfeifferi]|uniref:FMRFamide receptor n=1 Tax=Biomphalaria pfeifferi TaxID=112525 RepID=A0AAD8FKS7_BIOPF|nr:FMRFamide receptor [Biomphalaria pfeifferi]